MVDSEVVDLWIGGSDTGHWSLGNRGLGELGNCGNRGIGESWNGGRGSSGLVEWWVGHWLLGNGGLGEWQSGELIISDNSGKRIVPLSRDSDCILRTWVQTALCGHYFQTRDDQFVDVRRGKGIPI